MPPGRRNAARALDRAAQDRAAVRTAVVGDRRLERERVALEQVQLGRRDVGHDAGDDVDRPAQRGVERREEVAAVRLDAVGQRARDRRRLDVGRQHPRAARRQHRRDRAAAGAEVDRRRPRAAVRRRGEQRAAALGEQLGLPARDVDAGRDDDRQVAERRAAGDPGERLAGQAALDRRLQARAELADAAYSSSSAASSSAATNPLRASSAVREARSKCYIPAMSGPSGPRWRRKRWNSRAITSPLGSSVGSASSSSSAAVLSSRSTKAWTSGSLCTASDTWRS